MSLPPTSEDGATVPSPPPPPFLPPRSSSPPPRAPRRLDGDAVMGLIALSTLLFLLVGVILLSVNDDDDTTDVASSPTRTATPRPSYSRTVTAQPSRSPLPTTPPSPTNVADVEEGDCVINLGTDDNPDMQPAPCSGDGTHEVYEVVSKATGTFLGDLACGLNYEAAYVYEDEGDPFNNYVLCLESR